MKKQKKVLALVLCAVMLVASSVLATMAYLQDSDTVTNTFTVGKVGIVLNEAPVDADGQEVEGARVQENAYQLFPGKTYDKDPMVTVDADSEDCWLFVTVDNQIADIEVEGDTTIAAQMEANGWTLVEGTTDVYAYEAIKSAGETAVVFENFVIAGGVDNETLAEYANAKIIVNAYAIQAEGFDTAAEAWAAAEDEF